MRALDMTIYFFCIVLFMSAIPILLPMYNNGNGLPAGNTSGLTSTIAGMQLNGTSALGKTLSGSNTYDPITYTVQIIVTFITTVFAILSLMICCWPVLVAVFGIPAIMATIIQAILYIILGLGIIQAVRGSFTLKWME